MCRRSTNNANGRPRPFGAGVPLTINDEKRLMLKMDRERKLRELQRILK